MSRKSLDRVLKEMSISMQEEEKKKLYDDIKKDFSLIGSAERDGCAYFDAMLSDAYMKRRIKEYVRRWLEGAKAWSKKIDEEEKRKAKMEIYA